MNRSSKTDCPFCRMSRHDLNYAAVLEEEDLFAVMDLYPATPGHVLILPKRHIETVYEMPEDLGGHIMTATLRVAKVIKEKLSPIGLNLIQSNGAAAGQTISHFHLHIVPRYETDGVVIQFGHGNRPGKFSELERIASLLRIGLGMS